MKIKTNISLLCLAVSAALTGTAYAADVEKAKEKVSSQQQEKSAEQDKDADSVERISVTGVRSSIKESLFVKQNAINVVDAIIAEDIGKFPDQNIAEALQRMTGITISRNGGEGQNVTVRGLGGDYNVTTINGRRMASEHSSRNFNYDLIASELLGSVEVYKSPVSKNVEGGIGSVINIKTRRPLDLDGFTLSGSAKAIYGDLTEDYNPSASFLVSDTFNDDTFGALFTAVYSERTIRSDSYEGQGFYDEDEGINFVTVPVDSDGNGKIEGDEKSYESMIPGYVRYSNWQDIRTRTGASLALQWRPSDDLEVNFDSIYSSYDTDGSQYQISFVTYDEYWTPGIPSIGDLSFDDAGRVNSLELIDGAMAELLNVSSPRNTETFQVALNTSWQATDNLNLALDISHSESENKNAGDNRYVVARGFVDTIKIDQSGDNLLPDVTMSPALSSEQPFGAHYSYNHGRAVKDEVSEVRLDGLYVLDDSIFSQVEFGLNYGKQTKGRQQYRSDDPSMFSNGGAYFQYFPQYGDYDDSSVEELGGLNLFRLPGDVLVPANFDNFMAGEPGAHPAPWASFDYDKLYAFYESINAEAAAAKIKPTLQEKDSYELTESTLAAYIQTNLEGEFGELPYTLNLGVRAVQTTVKTSGYALDMASIEFEPHPTLEGVQRVKGGIQQHYGQQSFEDDYTNILPSMNFKLNLTDQVVYRLSAAKVLTRPNLGYLSPYSSLDLTKFEYHSSNPGLKPLEADQVDMTMEWYFSEYGALTAAIYYKGIESFIENGPRGKVDILGQEFEHHGPRNDKYGATIKGAEIAYQQSFDELLPEPFDGFGVQFNYTYVDSSYDDPERVEEKLPFAGMSKNSYNAVVYYEKNDVQARIAYNWRSKYLLYPDAWGGPQWQSDYGQYDFSSSYNISEKVSLNFTVSNLTNERSWGYIKRPEQVSHLGRYGRTATLGLTASF
ncbi:TonB-dependent receptor [Psychrobium sp. 1_MG-2023]|uniref:TonB-dependent receptor n=1 Tax=Psychrobium sp. 1_MG-2023 TaxID=3062624 RepID=UPI000C32FBBE|nr:TonB-dependent receptor [Psychrobium sp. 1_MG-2023]MDP2560749.1 TonB-dependent receptor [Psychrobium sp. 1_MG-2023]PKF56642.1 TonB-dependent receptor [Alteromonadales bacterium alter-6D02]